jgi:hypothetical protein
MDTPSITLAAMTIANEAEMTSKVVDKIIKKAPVMILILRPKVSITNAAINPPTN